jgi:hypothetical protein
VAPVDGRPYREEDDQRKKNGLEMGFGLVGPLLFFDLISSLLHFATGFREKKERGEGKLSRISKHVSNISKTELCLNQFTKI